MPRLHLLELEDQKWFPKNIRNFMTDLLNFQITHAQIYDPIVPILYEALIKTKSNIVIDLCAGGAGSSRRVQELLQHKYQFKTKVHLSDLYPNVNALFRIKKLSDPNITYLRYPVDATQVPSTLKGFRTLFTSFHHFKPEQARLILKDAVKNNQGIAIFELSERSLRGIILVFFSFLLTLLCTPFLRPFSLERLFFTYAIPIIPLSYLFDGIVSQLRSYTHKELLELAHVIDCTYHWEAGVTRHHYLPIYITYLVGCKSTKT